jgi:hypothetical protein
MTRCLKSRPASRPSPSIPPPPSLPLHPSPPLPLSIPLPPYLFYFKVYGPQEVLRESVCAGKYGVVGECLRGSMMCSCSQYIIARNNASRCPVAPCVHAQVRTHTCTHALTKSSRGGMGSGFYFFRVPARCSCGTLVRVHTHTHNTHTHTHTCTHLHTHHLFFFAHTNAHSQDLKEVEWIADVHGDVRLLRFLRKCKGDTDAAIIWWV